MTSNKDRQRVLTCYYRPKPGGYCKRLFRTINALLKSGHTVHYLAVVPFPITHHNCHFHRFPWPQKYTSGYLFWGFFHLFAPVQLFYLGMRWQINRLFAFSYSYGLFLQPLRIIKRIPLTVLLRADTIENHRILGRSSWLIGLERILEGLGIVGTRLYGVSETLTEKTVIRHNFLRPLTSGVLRNDIVVSRIGTTKRKTRIHLPLHLACVGVLEPRKNQQFLLDVMEHVDKKQAQLFLYGVGPDEQLLKNIVVERKLTAKVHFMGWVDAAKIWPAVDLLLMPSLHEGAPNAILEALGQGVPVIASDIPEHNEILPQSCLVAINTVKFLVERICFISGSVENLARIVEHQEPCVQQLDFDWGEAVVAVVMK